jgi:hypothetical protein
VNQLHADQLAEDSEDLDEGFESHDRMEAKSAQNDSLHCELGLQYLLLQSIMSGRKNHQTLQVNHIVPDIVSYIVPNIIPNIVSIND